MLDIIYFYSLSVASVMHIGQKSTIVSALDDSCCTPKVKLKTDNTFALPTEVFSSCLAIVSEVTVGGLFLWLSLRYGTGYQTV